LNIKQGVWREGAGGFCFETGKSQQVGTTRSSSLHDHKLVETALADCKAVTARSSNSTVLTALVPLHLPCAGWSLAGGWKEQAKAVTADNKR